MSFFIDFVQQIGFHSDMSPASRRSIFRPPPVRIHHRKDPHNGKRNRQTPEDGRVFIAEPCHQYLGIRKVPVPGSENRMDHLKQLHNPCYKQRKDDAEEQDAFFSAPG